MSDAEVMAESYSAEAASTTSYANDAADTNLGSNLGSSGGNSSSRITCRFCGKRFAQAGYVKAHERLHTGEKPYHCSVCGKQFSDPSNWKKHERVHTRQSPLPITEKPSFVRQTYYSLPSFQGRKLKMDSGNPNTCKICGKLFSSQSSLATHRRIHTGERPYRCNTCGKGFTQIGTLRTHERIHTGEKPYMCKVCGRTFAQCGSYKMHEKRHLNDPVRRCHICLSTFTTWPELQDHMSSHLITKYCQANGVEFPYAGSQEAMSETSEQSANGDIVESDTPPVSTMVDADSSPKVDEGYSSQSQMPAYVTSTPVLMSHGRTVELPPGLPAAMAYYSHVIRNESLPVTSQTADMEYSRIAYAHSLMLREHRVTDGQLSPAQDGGNIVTTTTRDTQATGMLHEVKYEDNNLTLDLSTRNQRAHSEDSSIASSHSTEVTDAAMNDESHPVAICRQNLNTRMIHSSSNSRKQKYPMRRCSSNNSSDYELPQSTMATLPPNSFTPPLDDKDPGDQAMISYLLSKGRVYKCQHCHMIFEDCTLYLLHNGFHLHDGNPFQCVICRISCKDRIEFNCHLTSHIK